MGKYRGAELECKNERNKYHDEILQRGQDFLWAVRGEENYRLYQCYDLLWSALRFWSDQVGLTDGSTFYWMCRHDLKLVNIATSKNHSLHPE